MQTSHYNETPLTPYSLPDNAFGHYNNVAFTATLGIGLRLNHLFKKAPLERGYRFFYLGQGQLAANTNQLLNTLKTGQTVHVTGGNTLTITPTIPNHCYPAMGLQVTTPGVTVTAGCDRYKNERCIFHACNNAPATLALLGGCVNAPGGTCRVFLSATTFPSGNINNADTTPLTNCARGTGALTRANCICNSDNNRPATGGPYYAWLSTGAVNASSNIKYSPFATYVNATNTAQIIASPGTLTSGNLANAISQLNGGAWTGSNVGGAATGSNCQDWTSASNTEAGTTGAVNANDGHWTNDGLTTCDAANGHLYCFEGQ